MNKLLVFALGSWLAFSACQSSQYKAERVVDVSQGGSRLVQEVHRGYSTICRDNGRDFPPSYRVSDVGKPDVPLLTSTQLQQVRAISRYVSSSTLRFQTVAGQFLVYDAGVLHTKATLDTP